MTDFDATQYKKQILGNTQPSQAVSTTGKPVDDKMGAASDTATDHGNKVVASDDDQRNDTSGQAPTEAKKTVVTSNPLGDSPKDDTTGTDDALDTSTEPGQGKPRGRVILAKPEQKIDDAIEAGVSAKELEDLQAKWNAYNRQQALLKISKKKAALADTIKANQRKLADQLLKLADDYGVTIKEARAIFEAGLKADKKAKDDAKAKAAAKAKAEAKGK